MTTLLQFVVLVMVAAGGVGVVTSRDPARQAVSASFYGLLLTVLFFVFQAPDVALSQLVVGVVAWPLMIMLTLAKVRGGSE
jgi:energy-converting hydrogenase B subunit D